MMAGNTLVSDKREFTVQQHSYNGKMDFRYNGFLEMSCQTKVLELAILDDFEADYNGQEGPRYNGQKVRFQRKYYATTHRGHG